MFISALLSCYFALTSAVTTNDPKLVFYELVLGRKEHRCQVAELTRHDDEDGQFTFTLRRRTKLCKENTETDFTAGRTVFFQLIDELTNFGISKYDARRDFDKELFPQLKNISREFADDSIWKFVVDQKTYALLGVLRFIHASYGIEKGEVVPDATSYLDHNYQRGRFRNPNIENEFDSAIEKAPPTSDTPYPIQFLPSERLLNIELIRENFIAELLPFTSKNERDGILWEAGGLATDETLPEPMRSRVKLKIWLSMVEVVFSHMMTYVNLFSQAVVTYADASSERMYSLLGFVPIRQYYLDGHLVEFKEGDKVIPIKKGKNFWTPMILEPSRLQYLHWLFVHRKNPRFKNLDPIEVLKNLSRPVGALWTPDLWIASLEGYNFHGRQALRKIFEQSTAIELALKSPSLENRQAAARAKENVRPIQEQAKVGLIEALKNENKNVRLNAAFVFGDRFHRAPESAKDDGDEVVEALARAVGDPVAEVRREALNALGSAGIKAKKVLEQIAIAFDDSEVSVRQAATEAFGNIVDHETTGIPPATLQKLIEIVQGELAHRKGATRALGKLSRLLGDRVPFISRLFTVQFFSLKSTSAGPHWEEDNDGKHPVPDLDRLRFELAKAMYELNGVLVPLLAVMNEGNHVMRLAAARVMIDSGLPRALDSVMITIENLLFGSDGPTTDAFYRMLLGMELLHYVVAAPHRELARPALNRMVDRLGSYANVVGEGPIYVDAVVLALKSLPKTAENRAIQVGLERELLHRVMGLPSAESESSPAHQKVESYFKKEDPERSSIILQVPTPAKKNESQE